MKKISVVLIFILAFLFAPAVHAEVQDTLSDEILVQAKAQADLFLELKNALGLDWLDKYNAYLQNPASKPVPTWDTSISSLINKGYLSAAFPTDFAVSISGNEAQISRNISSQAVRDAVKIYIPSATVSGNTVKLLVQRPAQWVAWEAALNGKVDRDGSGDPDILPGASLDFASGTSINFLSNDGKILGVDSLTYKGEEIEDRFVNVSGDNMTGPLYIEGNIVWHAGNDGSGSGLDADLLDGQHGSFYRDASNLNAGIVPVARLSGTYDISISGRAAVASNADYASNSDKLDGKDSSAFALTGHTHGYVSKTGDTMTGVLIAPEYRLNDDNTRIYEGSNNSVRIQTNNGYVDIGPQNTGWVLFNTDRPEFYFGKPVEAEGMLKIYNTGTYLTGTEGKIAGNTVWHAGNDGSGSGLDADKLDGKHASDFLSQPIRIPAGQDLNNYTTPGMYYCPLNVDAQQIANTPVNLAFSLLVEQHAGVKQTFTQYYSDDPKTWVRNLYAGVWGPWKEVGMGSGGGWDVILEARTTGDGSVGSWATWPLNAVAYNNGVLISLSSNQFTLPSGTYCIEWDMTAFRTLEGKTRLYNVTSGSVVAYGSSYYSARESNFAIVPSFGTAITTITYNSTFRIQYYHNGNSSLSLGVPGAGGGVNMFGQVRIKKME